MTALPARRAPRRCDDGASARAFTRRPTTAGSMRRTYDGIADTALGASRGGAGRGTAVAIGAATLSGSHSDAARTRAVHTRRVMRRSAVCILTLVPGAELARFQRTPPRLVLAIPAHRRFERGRERMPGPPAEPADFRRIYRIAAIVSGAVGHGADERLELAGEAKNFAREHDVLDLMAAADVVDLAVFATTQDEVDSRAVVEDVEPVADVAAVAVQGQRLVVQRVGDEQRHHLFGILVRTEVVRRACDHDRHAVRAPVRQRQQVTTGFGCRIRIRRAQRVRLARRALRDAAIDLVGADVQEARDLERPHRFQQREDAEHVGAEERVGLDERAVDVRLGREVHDRVGAAEDVTDERRIADVALHERVAPVARDVREIGRISRVRELVEIDDAVVRVLAQDVADEVAPDEARAAGDDELHWSGCRETGLSRGWPALDAVWLRSTAWRCSTAPATCRAARLIRA